jgi:hypothetical protein
MSFIYCHLNFHASLLRPWRFPLEKNPKECLKENLIRVTRECLIRGIICLPIASTRVHPRFFGGVGEAHLS